MARNLRSCSQSTPPCVALHRSYVQSVAVDAHKIVSADATGHVVITNRHTLRQSLALRDHAGWVMGMSMTDRRLITGCSSHRVMVYEFDD